VPTSHTSPSPSPGDCERCAGPIGLLASPDGNTEPEIAAPELDGPQHAPSPARLTPSANGSVAKRLAGAGHDDRPDQTTGGEATTAALTFLAFSWKRNAVLVQTIRAAP